MKLTFKNRFYYSIVLISCFISLFSCTTNKSDNIRIGVLNGPSAISFIQLISKPIKIDNKQVDIIIKSEPIQIQALMLKDELDFAILPTVMAANLYNKGLKYRMMACPVWGTLYLLSDGTVNNNEELNNQTISVFGQGGTSDMLIQRMIQKKGLKNVKLDYTFNTNNELSQAMLLGKIKLAVVSEPLVSNLVSKNKSIKVLAQLSCEEYVGNVNRNVFVQTSFLVSERYIDKYPSIIRQIRDAYSASCNFVNEQPDAVAQLMVKHQLSTNINLAKKSIPLCNIRYVAAFAISQEVNEYLNIFYQFNPKSVGDKIPDNNFIYQLY